LIGSSHIFFIKRSYAFILFSLSLPYFAVHFVVPWSLGPWYCVSLLVFADVDHVTIYIFWRRAGVVVSLSFRPTRCQMQDAVYHFSVNRRPHSHLRIQRPLVENVAKNSILSFYDLGSVIIVVRLYESNRFLLDDKG
jgi:hypothetical protein